MSRLALASPAAWSKSLARSSVRPSWRIIESKYRRAVHSTALQTAEYSGLEKTDPANRKRKPACVSRTLHHCLPTPRRWSAPRGQVAPKKRLPTMSEPAPPTRDESRLSPSASATNARCPTSHDFRIQRDVFMTKRCWTSWRLSLPRSPVRHGRPCPGKI